MADHHVYVDLYRNANQDMYHCNMHVLMCSSFELSLLVLSFLSLNFASQLSGVRTHLGVGGVA